MRRFLVPVLAGLLALAVVPPAQAADPTVEIIAPTTVQPAGKSINVVVRVRNANNATVSVGAEVAGKTYYLCGGQNVSDDDFNCELFLYYNTRMFVTLDNTVVATRDFRVRPVIGTQVKSGYAVVGRYRVMPARTSPKFLSAKTPATGGTPNCLKHQVQRYRAGAWRTVFTSGCRSVDSKGRVTWTWAGTHPSRVNFRVRATFPGNSWNAAGPGRWTYFRFR